MRLALLIIMGFLTLSLSAKEPAYFVVKAKNGDGVYSILRRYQLLGSSENIRKFYELNGLSVNSNLIKGKEYKLPVLVYDYDGTSIRSTMGIDDMDMARRIEAYNVSLKNLGIVDQVYTDSKELWVPMHTLAVDVSDRPPTKTISNSEEQGEVIEVPLFGDKYSSVRVSSQMLRGQVFYIVSGHGGPDPGAMSEVSGKAICEDEYAYDVSLRLARKLMEHGATVEVIVQDPNDGIRDIELLGCDKDELSNGKTKIPIRQLIRLQQRTHEVNTLYRKHKQNGVKEHTVVCIHVDSRSPQKRQDVFFYYCEGSKSGKSLADDLQSTFRAKYEKYRPSRGYRGTVSSRNLYVLRNTDPPAVYVELANIKNIQDRKRILPKENRQALANWLFEGLTK